MTLSEAILHGKAVHPAGYRILTEITGFKKFRNTSLEVPKGALRFYRLEVDGDGDESWRPVLESSLDGLPTDGWQEPRSDELQE